MWNPFTQKAQIECPHERDTWLLALYEVEYSNLPPVQELLTQLGGYIGDNFNRIELVRGVGRRSTSSKIRWPGEFSKKLGSHSDFSSITVELIVGDDYLTSTVSMSCDIAHRMFTAHAPATKSSAHERESMLIDAARVLCPKYGFSHVVRGNLNAIGWPRGVSDNSLSVSETLRLSTLCVAIEDGSRPLSRKMHDIYRENVLSDQHLQINVFDDSLERWISRRGIGKLTRIACGVSLWKLTEPERTIARRELNEANLILASEL